MPKISATRKDQRRRQILAAAATCFARQGFQTTTIQDICAEGGLSIGAVYSYYGSKDAIIAALAERGRRQADERTASVDRSAAPHDRLKSYLKEFDVPGRAVINQFDLRSWAEAIGNRQLRALYLDARAETIKALADILKPAAVARGLTPDALAELTLAVIVGCETRRAIQPAADVSGALDALVALLDFSSTRRTGK